MNQYIYIKQLNSPSLSHSLSLSLSLILLIDYSLPFSLSLSPPLSLSPLTGPGHNGEEYAPEGGPHIDPHRGPQDQWPVSISGSSVPPPSHFHPLGGGVLHSQMAHESDLLYV